MQCLLSWPADYEPVRFGPVYRVRAAPSHRHADDASDDAMRSRDVKAIVGSDELKYGAEPQDYTHPEGQCRRVLHEGALLGDTS
jgi:hypothetical protein